MKHREWLLHNEYTQYIIMCCHISQAKVLNQATDAATLAIHYCIPHQTAKLLVASISEKTLSSHSNVWWNETGLCLKRNEAWKDTGPQEEPSVPKRQWGEGGSETYSLLALETSLWMGYECDWHQ